MKLAVRCLLHNIAFYSFFRNTLLVWLANPLVYRNGLPSDTGMCDAGGYYNSFFLISGSAIFSITAPAPYISDKHLKIKVSYNHHYYVYLTTKKINASSPAPAFERIANVLHQTKGLS